MTASSRSSQHHALVTSGLRRDCFLERISNRKALGKKTPELDMTAYSRSSQCAWQEGLRRDRLPSEARPKLQGGLRPR
jgi:hypothetical protein